MQKSVIEGVRERKRACVCVRASTNGISPSFYTIGIQLTGWPVGKLSNPKRKESDKKQIKQTQKDSLIQSVKPHYGLIEARNKLGQTHRSSLFPTETTQTLVHPSNRSSIQLAHT